MKNNKALEGISYPTTGKLKYNWNVAISKEKHGKDRNKC